RKWSRVASKAQDLRVQGTRVPGTERLNFLMHRVVVALSLIAHVALAQPSRHRAILISFDGFSEDVARMFIDSVNTPTLWSMFRTASCAERVRPAFVSVTPAGHAAI